MAALITENFRFLSLFFKSKDVMIFNGLVALGTVGSQELFTVVAFHCPCSPARNYLYGLTAIGVPALALFLIGVILNKHTWNLVAECQYRRSKNCSAAPTFLLLSSILGRAAVAPVTWSVISLLRGEAYVCALSEFVDPSSLKAGEEVFPPAQATEILARFPCGEGPANLSNLREEVSRRLKYESQVRQCEGKLFFPPQVVGGGDRPAWPPVKAGVGPQQPRSPGKHLIIRVRYQSWVTSGSVPGGTRVNSGPK
ncbi:calcium homeostasis modulator family member 2 [Rhinolophus ferrumequinum]|uniref:Calcium homeostasis modulator family member 2 n=1 Tax=Rhinolophus ferrumequinum TaxID=59479 RepID=A0A7J7UVJ6_RHIFE|nr:calcium homeostasis modulator family member 2 [Rhinolophus ferrumequinum]